MGVEVKQLLSAEIVDALFGANSPSAANPFATIADIQNWANTNLTLTGNRVHDFDSNTIIETNVAGYTTNLQAAASRVVTWSDGGGTTITAGHGINPTGFGGAGESATYLSTAGTKAYYGAYNSGSNAYFQGTVYDSAFSTDESGVFAGFVAAGGNSTYAQLYHNNYLGGFTGFEANVFGERIISQASGLNIVSPLGAGNGIVFLSGAGGTGYIGVTDQAGFASWVGTTLNQTWASVLSTGNTSGGTNAIMTAGDTIESSVASRGQLDLHAGGEYVVLLTNDGGNYGKEGLYLDDSYLALFAAGYTSYFQAGPNYSQTIVDDITISMRGDGGAFFIQDRGIVIADVSSSGYTTYSTFGDLAPDYGVIIASGGSSLPDGSVISVKDVVIIGSASSNIVGGTGISQTVIAGGSSINASKSNSLYVPQIVHYNSAIGGFDTILTFTGATGSDQTQTFQNASGTIALLSDITAAVTITDDRVPRGTGTAIEDGTWENVGNDLRPVNAGSNLGGTAVANRISTIYMASTVDFSGTLNFTDGTNTIYQVGSTGIVHNPGQIASIDHAWRSDTNATAMVFDATGAGNFIINGGTAAGSGFTVYANGGFGTVLQGSSTSPSAYALQIRNGAGTPASIALFRDSGRVDLNVAGLGVTNIGNISGTAQLNIADDARIINTSGNAFLQIQAAVGQAYLSLNNTVANGDSYIHFAHSGVNETTIGWDESAGMFRMGLGAITTGTFYEYNPSVSAGRHVSSLGIGGTFPGTDSRLKVRGISTDGTTTYGLTVQKLNGIPVFRTRDDGFMQVNTQLTQLSGVGGTYNVRGIISDRTSDSSAAEIESGFGQRLTNTPTSDSTVRSSAGRFSMTKTGAFETYQNSGLIAEATNLGTGNLDLNSSAGLFGLQAFALNQTTGTVTINQLIGVVSNVQTNAVTSGVSVDAIAYQAKFDNNTNATYTNMIAFDVVAPANLTGASITNTYVLKSDANTQGTNNWGLYIEGANTENYFQGNVSIGATTTVNSPFEVTGDIEAIGSANGLILESPDGTRWQMKIDNSGSWTFTSLP